jgi:2,5-furandicarboxylate decarboxylase 1
VQVKKRGAYDDGWIPNLIINSFAAFTGLRLAVFVDEDVDIHNGEDVFWAMATRVDPDRDLFILPGGKGTGMMPVEFADQSTERILSAGKHFKGIGVDATIPFNLKGSFERACYPSYKIDLKKWFSEEDIAAIRASQSDYAKLLAKTGG